MLLQTAWLVMLLKVLQLLFFMFDRCIIWLWNVSYISFQVKLDMAQQVKLWHTRFLSSLYEEIILMKNHLWGTCLRYNVASHCYSVPWLYNGPNFTNLYIANSAFNVVWRWLGEICLLGIGLRILNGLLLWNLAMRQAPMVVRYLIFLSLVQEKLYQGLFCIPIILQDKKFLNFGPPNV